MPRRSPIRLRPGLIVGGARRTILAATAAAAVCGLVSSHVHAQEGASRTGAARSPRNERRSDRPSQRQLPQGFIHRTVKSADGRARKYALYVPAQYDLEPEHKWPLIVFLHGSAEKGRDGFKQTTVGLPVYVSRNATRFPFLVVMPQARQMWFRGEEATAVWTILEDVLADYRVDRDRIHLTGISMGGIGTWEMAVMQPHVFASIVPVCGFAPKQYLKNVVDLPTWVFHGALDRNVSVNGSRDAVAELKRLGGTPNYTEYPKLQHNCWDEAYATPDLWRWMLQQRRKPPPKTIDYLFPGGVVRVWWLAVDAAEDAKRPMHVRAEVKDDGRIDIASEGVAGWAIISDGPPLPPGTQVDVTWNGRHVYRGAFQGILSYEPKDEKGAEGSRVPGAR